MGISYRFDRYRHGKKMAEGILVENADSFEQAMITATALLTNDYPRTDVLVFEGVDALQAERDQLMKQIEWEVEVSSLLRDERDQLREQNDTYAAMCSDKNQRLSMSEAKRRQAERESDALASHLERVESSALLLIDGLRGTEPFTVTEQAIKGVARVDMALSDKPRHSLEQRDARMKAEALNHEAVRHLLGVVEDGNDKTAWIKAQGVMSLRDEYLQQAGGDDS